MIFNIELVKASDLTDAQQSGLDALNRECFGDVEETEIQERFTAEPFAYLFATSGKEMISRVVLFKREVEFNGQKIMVGEIGGICVATAYRHHGVVSSMVKRALLTLREQKCDVACLNVDPGKKTYPVYEKLGFKIIDQEKSTIFASLSTTEKYELATKWWHSRSKAWVPPK